MLYRTMPGSDEELSILGYGCMRLPTHVGGAASNLIDRKRATAQLRLAIDRGVNYVDTAWPYHAGASESFLGEHGLTDGYRDKVYLATKLPCMTLRKAEAMEQTLSKQLAKLRTDHIDYYLLHALNGPTWDRMLRLGVLDFMERVKADGRVRHMGFSFHGRKEDFMRIVDGYDFEFAQVQFNLVDEHFQAGIEGIEYCAEKGMGVIVMEPLRGGSLVGKIPAPVQKLYDSAPLQRSPAEWALRWVWNHPAVTLLLSGMNEEAHIDENIRVASEARADSLSQQEVELVERVRQTYDELLQVGCTGCAYCMPCPEGIDIPNAFKMLNDFHMFSRWGARILYAQHAGINTPDGQPRWTTSCIDCGKCEKKCPQDLPIREHFAKVQADLEGPLVKTIAALARLLLRPREPAQLEDSSSA